MRTTAAVILLTIIGTPPALADSWRAKPVLEPGSPSHCRDADVSTLFFDLTQTGNELSVKVSSGEAFSAPIAANGHVKTTVKVPVGRRNLAVDLVGNVKTQEMEAFHKQYACRFKLARLP